MNFDDRPEPAKRLEKAREARGFGNAAEACRYFGWNYITYTQHEKGTRGLSRAAEKYAKAFRVGAGWLLSGEGREPGGDTAISNATVGDTLSIETNKKIPLYGHAVGGVDGEFVLNGNKLDDITAPPSISGVTGAYAVTVAGESMLPRYEDGETVFVDPIKRLVRGDYVVAQIQLEEEGPVLAFIKRFVRHNASELVLEQLNPPKELAFPHNRVVSVDYVAMGGRLS